MRTTVTIQDCWRHYEENHLRATVDVHANRAYWRRLSVLGKLVADRLSPGEVDRYTGERQAAGARPGTINRELALLRAALRHSERHGLIAKAPIIKSLPKPAPSLRSLSRQEASKLVKVASGSGWRDQVYIRLALGTGQRSSAILDLEWDRVDLTNQNLDFRVFTEKSQRMKRRMILPMNAMTSEAIKIARQHYRPPYVLHYEGKRLHSPREIMARLAKMAGLEGVTPHVLRHTVASILLQEGEELLHVSRLLGHSSTLVTQQVYFQHPPSWLKKTTSLLSF